MAIIEHYLCAAENCKRGQRRAISKDSLITEDLYWNEGPEGLYHTINHHELAVALPIVRRFLIAVLAAAIGINMKY